MIDDFGHPIHICGRLWTYLESHKPGAKADDEKYKCKYRAIDKQRGCVDYKGAWQDDDDNSSDDDDGEDE